MKVPVLVRRTLLRTMVGVQTRAWGRQRFVLGRRREDDVHYSRCEGCTHAMVIYVSNKSNKGGQCRRMVEECSDACAKSRSRLQTR